MFEIRISVESHSAYKQVKETNDHSITLNSNITRFFNLTNREILLRDFNKKDCFKTVCDLTDIFQIFNKNLAQLLKKIH